MAIRQGICDSYLLEEKQGVHVWGTDVFKVALFSSDAALNHLTTAYSVTNEITGTGYVAGGKTLDLAATYPKMSGRNCLTDFDDLVWNPAAFTARYGLIYNSSKGDKAVAVIDFGQELQAINTFTIAWAAPTETTATIRSAAAQ